LHAERKLRKTATICRTSVEKLPNSIGLFIAYFLSTRNGEKMAVNTIGQSTYASGLQQKQQNMNNMFSALKSGDMVSAQKAYAASGLPPQATNNTSPLGRLYQALRHEDLAGAQKAALDMQGKSGKSASTPVNPTPSNSNAQTPAQKTAAALAQASIKAQQSSILAMLGQGTNVNTWG
jgi:hypothetical protein